MVWADREIREGTKLSYKQVSKDTGIPISVLTRYTSQKVRRYDVETLEKLCEYFGVKEISELLVYYPAKRDKG